TYVYGDAYRYNIEKNEWKPVTSPNSPPPRSAHQGVAWKTGSSVLVSRNSLDFGSDLWRLDLNTNIWREQLQLKGCPGARSGHRLWQEIKPKLGAAWPSAGTGSQLAVYLDEIFLYGGYFKEPAPDKDQSDKGEKIRYGSWPEQDIVHILSGGVVDADEYGFNACVGKTNVFCRYERSRQKKSDTTTFPRWTFDVWKCIIEETQSAWIEASKEKGETDGDNSDAGSINKGKDEEDDDEPGETLRDFFSWTIMYWQMAPYDHTQHTGKELRKDGFDLAKTRYRQLKPVLDKLARLEADHNAEEEATKPSKERSKKKR
ncbi:hypothetical protein SELMODRAFT_432445, partial [Selaginella moellendorffii]